MRNLTSIAAWSLVAVFLTLASAGAEILLFEDFDDGVADEFLPLSGQWSVYDQKYNGYTEGYEIMGVSVAGDEGWGDYRFECDHFVWGSINQMLRFRVNDDGRAYEVNVRAAPYNDAFLYKNTPDIRIELAHYPNFANEIEIWHHWGVMLLGDRIIVRFDDQPLFDHVDTEGEPVLNGKIGLCSYSGGAIQYQIARFDNVLVESVVTTTESSNWSTVKRLY